MSGNSWPTPFPLPHDTAEVLVKARKQCANLGLWLDRYVDYELDRKDNTYKPSERARRRKERDGRNEWLLSSKRLESVIQAHYARWRASLSGEGRAFREFQAEPEWRVVVGLGGPSPLETAITLHRVYGFPVIPGSGLKGMARAYAELGEGKNEHDPEFWAVFGGVRRVNREGQEVEERAAGLVCFLDAVPKQPPNLELDVMNPHYPNYYQGDEPPANYQSPVPIYFLTVGQSSPFAFGVVARTQDGNNHLDKAVEWLQGGLREMGTGGKTTAGYGIWHRFATP
ncbi:MAG TPA: type III-B CRISPR module RAMP protein Cmr6 [Chloroflexi bacterium]|nr:type III-B CRISPR module RAMP protein Cmr6 [Chloroflexota bacterium]